MKTNSSPSFLHSCPVALATVFLLALGNGKSSAANGTWNNTGTDWNTASNWMSNTLPTAGAQAIFTGTVVTSPNLSANYSVGQLVFGTLASSGYDVTSSSTAIALTLSASSGGVSSAIYAQNTTGTNTVDAPITLSSATSSFNQLTASTKLIINGTVSGSSLLSLIGSGTIKMTGSNTYSGGTILGGGTTIQVSQLGNTGFAGNLGTGGLTTAAFAVTPILNYIGAGETSNKVITLTGTNGGLTLDTTGATGGLVLTSNFVDTATGTKLLTLTGDSTGNEIQGKIVDGGGATSITKTGTGTWTLSGANTNTGATNIQAGQLSVSSLNSVIGGSASSNLGAPITSTAGTIGLGSGTTTGTLVYTGAGETTDRVINLAGTTGGGTIESNGTGAVVFSTALGATGAGAKTLTLQGSNTGANTIVGVIKDNSGTNHTSLAKAGAGTWVLAAANTYTGGTSISGTGKLLATNTTGSAIGTGELTVASGATIGGTGKLVLTGGAFTVNGNVQVGDGATATGQMTLSSTAASTFAGATLAFSLDATNSNVLNVGNTNLTFSGTTLSLNLLASPTNTNYTLISGSGSQVYGGFATFTNGMGQSQIISGGGLNLAFANGGYANSYLFVSGNNIEVAVVPEPSVWALMLGGMATLVVCQRRKSSLL